MDDRRFDDLSRTLAAGISRRTALKGAVAGVLGLLGAGRANAQISQAQCGNVSCKNNPGRCNPGCVCCVLGNGNSRCRPPDSCGNGGVQACPPGTVLDLVLGCVAPIPTTTAAPTTTTAAPTTTTVPPTTTLAPTTTTTTSTSTSTTAAPTTTTTTTATTTSTTAAPTTTTSTTTSPPGGCATHSDCGDPCAVMCNGGTCFPDFPALGDGSECAPGMICDAGVCQPAPLPCGPACTGPECACPNCQVCAGAGVCQPVVCESGGTCHTRVCNPDSGNSGECVPVPASDDTPCAGGDGVCCEGVCLFGELVCPATACGGDQDCGGGQSCCGGVCLDGGCQCATAVDCAALGLVGTRCAPVVCQSGLCVVDPRGVQNFDCDTGIPCRLGLCDGGGTCITTDDEIFCAGMGFDSFCSFGGCDPATGQCRAYPHEDRIGQPCEDNMVCFANATCQPDGTCGGGEDTCGECGTCLGLLCQPAPAGTTCGADGSCCGVNCCAPGEVCGANGRCFDRSICTAKSDICTTDAQCCSGDCVPLGSVPLSLCACSPRFGRCIEPTDCCSQVCEFVGPNSATEGRCG